MFSKVRNILKNRIVLISKNEILQHSRLAEALITGIIALVGGGIFGIITAFEQMGVLINEIERGNDIAAVTAKLMTPEEFHKKWDPALDDSTNKSKKVDKSN